MARFHFIFYCNLYLVSILCLVGTSSKPSVKVYELDNSMRKNPREISRNENSPVGLDVFCYEGETKKRLGRLFSSATFKLRIVGDKYQLYKGHNESSVIEQFEKSQQSWFSFLPWQTDSVHLEIFNRSCVGVQTRQNYAVQLQLKAVDPYILMFLVFGLLLFLTASRLSKNVLFYYGAGVSVGIVASLLILVFIISRFLPKKHYGAYAVLVGGWSIALYIFQKVWENVQLYLDQYFQYVVGYLLAAGLVSFAICYYKGPPSNPRSLNLVQWGIQCLALVLMFFGTSIPVVSLTIIAMVILAYNFPPSLGQLVVKHWRRRFPPKQRLLTEEEFIKQGNEETQRALEELREFCRSPNCDAWRTVSRLQTPHKFAEWVEGSSHVSESEFDAYDTYDSMELPSYLETDDEDEINFRLNSP